MNIAAKVIVAAIATSLVAGAAHAVSLKVFPVSLVLSERTPVQTITLQNLGPEPARLQMRVFAWNQKDGEDVFADTRDILANPASFEIPSGGTQIARLGSRAPTGPIEKSYRVFIEQVPGGRVRPGEVQTLLRLSIPIFLPPAHPYAHLSCSATSIDARTLSLEVRNQGNTHVQIHGIRISRAGTPIASQNLSAYVLPGTTKRLTVETSATVLSGERLQLIAITDEGDVEMDSATGATVGGRALR